MTCHGRQSMAAARSAGGAVVRPRPLIRPAFSRGTDTYPQNNQTNHRDEESRIRAQPVQHQTVRRSVLVHDGQPVHESSIINEYIDDALPGPKLSPHSPLRRARMREFIRICDEGLPAHRFADDGQIPFTKVAQTMG